MDTLSNFEISDNSIKEMTLAQIVSRNYKAAAIFEKYGMDFCCKGNRLFNEACGEKGVNREQIFKEILNAGTAPFKGEMRYNNWEPDFLADYIINNHHQYVRDCIPVIAMHSEKAIAAHGKNHPELSEIGKLFTAVYKDLQQHLMKEEKILFPYIKFLVRVKAQQAKYERPYFGKISNPIGMMEAEHEAAGDAFFEIHRLSENYTVPEDACGTYSVFYKELKEFEEDLHMHIHLENNILFPKATALEEQIVSRI